MTTRTGKHNRSAVLHQQDVLLDTFYQQLHTECCVFLSGWICSLLRSHGHVTKTWSSCLLSCCCCVHQGTTDDAFLVFRLELVCYLPVSSLPGNQSPIAKNWSTTVDIAKSLHTKEFLQWLSLIRSNKPWNTHILSQWNTLLSFQKS